MPLTAAEKQKRYRERLKEKGEYEKYKEKNKKLKEKVRNTLCKSAKSKLKKKNRIYKRNERKRKSNNVNVTIQSPENPDASNASIFESPGPITEVDITSPSKIFSTRQSLGKAKKRVISVLPKSPNKRKALVHQIAKDEGLLGKNNKISSAFQVMNDESTNEISKQVVNFFNDDTVSSQAPGMKDFVICRENGNKTRMQKRYLYLTLKETYALFCKENSEVKIGLSKFCSLRPNNILLSKNIPHNVCLCQKHENIRLLLKVLHNKGINVVPEFKEFIKSVVCDDENELCMTGGCNSCPMLNGISEDEELHAEMCNWNEWVNQPQCYLRVNEGTIKDCINELNTKLPSFLVHTFVKRKQANEFKERRESLINGEVVLQIDFAENFCCKEQNEVQSAHWSHHQVTIFTAVSWYLRGCEREIKSYAIISDCLDHDKYAVNAFLEAILESLKSLTNINTLHIFSNGPSSQFKQRYNLCNLTYFCQQFQIQEIQWHFFATSHGKGAVDGIGGEVKRSAWMEVLGGKSINNASDFFHIVKNKVKKITMILISNQYISDTKITLDKRFCDIQGIPNIRNMHHFKVTQENVISYSQYTKSTTIKEHKFLNGITAKNDAHPVIITKENYYAVYYDLQFYIGRVIDDGDQKVKIKFLKKGLGQSFEWPKDNDIEEVDKHFIFYGPIMLEGSGPFCVPEEKTIAKAYNKLKKVYSKK